MNREKVEKMVQKTWWPTCESKLWKRRKNRQEAIRQRKEKDLSERGEGHPCAA